MTSGKALGLASWRGTVLHEELLRPFRDLLNVLLAKSQVVFAL